MSILFREEFIHPTAPGRTWCNKMVFWARGVEVKFGILRSILMNFHMMEPKRSPTIIFNNILSSGIKRNGKKVLCIWILGEDSDTAVFGPRGRLGSMSDTAASPAVEIPVGRMVSIPMKWRNPPANFVLLRSKSRPIWAQTIDTEVEADGC